MYWVTNSDGSLHTYLDVSWVTCYHALIMAESLNKGIFPEIIQKIINKHYNTNQNSLQKVEL